MRTVMWIVGALIEIGFLVLTFMSNARATLIGSDPYALFVLISVNIAFLVLWLNLRVESLDRSLEAKLADLRGKVKALTDERPGVSTLVDQEFYAKFGWELRNAKVGVAISHLDTRPPVRPRKTDTGDYYSTMLKCIKANSRAKFRRVERASTEKREWLDELIKDFGGVENFSLAVLLLETSERRTGLVSIQIVDDLHTIQVAVAEHDSSFGPRDVWIRDRDTTVLWKTYYEEMLWTPAAKVLENGVLNKGEWGRVLKFIDAQCRNT